jgi:hypothetical protein
LIGRHPHVGRLRWRDCQGRAGCNEHWRSRGPRRPVTFRR